MMSRSQSSQNGAALIMVLILTVVLVMAITEMMRSVSLSSSLTVSFSDSQKGALLAEGGIKMAARLLQGRLKEDRPVTNKELSMFVVPVARGPISIKVEDESGKLNINKIVFTNGEKDENNYQSLRRLLVVSGLDVMLADSLADWIDGDDVPRHYGAETADHSGTIKPAYASKGAMLDSVEELTLVSGFTKENYLNIAPFITVYGDGKVNINTASTKVLMTLSEQITEIIAKRIIERREREPFSDPSEVRSVPGMETVGISILARISVRTWVYKIIARAEVSGTVKEVEAIIDLSKDRVLYWRET